MAKVLIAEHLGRVSPVFDVASNVQILEFRDGLETGRAQAVLRTVPAILRTEEICALGADVVICGAVSRCLEEALLSKGLQVFSFICGGVEEVITAFLTNGLHDARFAMPGCSGREQRGKGGCRGRRDRERGIGRRNRRGRNAHAGTGEHHPLPSPSPALEIPEQKTGAASAPASQCPMCGATLTRKNRHNEEI